MPVFSLDLVPYIVGFPPDPGSAAVDIENNRVILNQEDIPPDGATLEITVLTTFIRASALDSAKAAQIAAAEKNSSDGIIELLLKDESIIEKGVAVNKAVSELRMKSQPNITLTFETEQDGYKEGDVFVFIDTVSVPPINILLTIQTVSQTFQETINNVDKFKYNITASPYIIDPDYTESKLIQRFLNPIKGRLAKIETM